MNLDTRVNGQPIPGMALLTMCVAMLGCQNVETMTFCEAVAKEASMDELTLLLQKDGEPLTDGMASRIEDPRNEASPCAYEVKGGRVVSAKLLK